MRCACYNSEKTRPKSVTGIEKPKLFLPTKTVIDTEMFCNLFPFHVVFDQNLEIIQYGIKMQTMSGILNPD